LIWSFKLSFIFLFSYFSLLNKRVLNCIQFNLRHVYYSFSALAVNFRIPLSKTFECVRACVCETIFVLRSHQSSRVGLCTKILAVTINISVNYCRAFLKHKSQIWLINSFIALCLRIFVRKAFIYTNFSTCYLEQLLKYFNKNNFYQLK